ncbi:hypothetical protein DKX38_018609 [Salix brachista]|uniref:HPP transmembrane region domain-containing protein n=1 Tax=Salix brachista TaxID=2182728 RepID=A0A5N5KNI0_9ROSI|nr:hypothetical protein DKX38_018609 [Salix brachista]
MGMQVKSGYFHQHHNPPTLPISPSTASILYSSSLSPFIQGSTKINLQRLSLGFSSKITAKSSNVSAPLWDSWKPDNSPASTPFRAFVAMAIFGKMDQMLVPKGISMTMAPLGAVSALLFVTPSSPAIGVFAFSVFGPGWLARSVALAASIAFMVYTRSTHPSAASLPLLFIDGAKFHHLHLCRITSKFEAKKKSLYNPSGIHDGCSNAAHFVKASSDSLHHQQGWSLRS